MSEFPEKNLNTLSERMRGEWDRRIQHDYRFWMSDGVESDEAMWAVGERDFQILYQDVFKEDTANLTALEIGCGVGRLLRPASARFKKVIGVDVSKEALLQAQELLDDLSNVELIQNDGLTISLIPDQSIDFAFSFAALTSMPVPAIANYFCELSRIVRLNKFVTLQVYLGHQQNTVQEDTIAIRSFDPTAFYSAINAIGFELVNEFDLVLPFKVSAPEEGLNAKIVVLQKHRQVKCDPAVICQMLLPNGEQQANGQWQGSKTEYFLAIARAEQHMNAGRAEQAREALEYATKCYRYPEAEVVEILQKLTEITKQNVSIVSEAFEEKYVQAASQAVGNNGLVTIATLKNTLGELFNAEAYQRNLKVIEQRFPELYTKLLAPKIDSKIEVTRATNGDPIITLNDIALDQLNKPQESARLWAQRSSADGVEQKTSKCLVIGFAGGYHLEALIPTNKEVHVFEPNVDVLKVSIACRDQVEILSRISGFYLGQEDLNKLLAHVDSKVLFHPQTKVASKESVELVKTKLISEQGFKTLRPSTAVVGPFYGGSLPISIAAAGALKALKQRSRLFDLSGFSKAFHSIGSYFSSPEKSIGLENEYVKLVSKLVLDSIDENPVDIVISLAQAPLTPQVLQELRNRGIITAMWFVEDYRRFSSWRDLAKYYDYMFLIQKGDAIKAVEAAGAGKAIYLPVGCDPEMHKPIVLSPADKARWGSEISFVGAGYNNRVQTFASLANRNFKIWGTEWPTVPPFTHLVQEEARRLSVEEYVNIFNASTININLHSSSERDGVEPNGDFVNPRTFELAAAGAFQLVDNRKYLPEMFEVGKEVITFFDRRELTEKIDYYLAHPEERVKVTTAARERVLRDHTYQQRLKQLLGHIYADRYEELKSRTNNDVSAKMIRSAKSVPELQQRLQQVVDSGGELSLDAMSMEIFKRGGKLDEVDKKLLFLKHIKTEIQHVKKSFQTARK